MTTMPATAAVGYSVVRCYGREWNSSRGIEMLHRMETAFNSLIAAAGRLWFSAVTVKLPFCSMRLSFLNGDNRLLARVCYEEFERNQSRADTL